MTPRYHPHQTYQWNYDNAPNPPAEVTPLDPVPGNWNFCGIRIPSPLGIPAGPLLNGG